jgi:hypothetical protein
VQEEYIRSGSKVLCCLPAPSGKHPCTLPFDDCFLIWLGRQGLPPSSRRLRRSSAPHLDGFSSCYLPEDKKTATFGDCFLICGMYNKLVLCCS